MSDLAATNCGCGDVGNNGCCSSIIWILILLSCCGCGNGMGMRNGCGDNSCIWIILLLFFCGGLGCNGEGFCC